MNKTRIVFAWLVGLISSHAYGPNYLVGLQDLEISGAKGLVAGGDALMPSLAHINVSSVLALTKMVGEGDVLPEANTWSALDLSGVDLDGLTFPIRNSSLFTDPHGRTLTSSQCKTFPQAYTPTRFCSGVVDYPYLVPFGYADSDLELTARTYAARLGVSLFKTACLTDVKRFICANVYSKCVSADGSSTQSIQAFGNTIPLPFYRPCQSICTAVSYQGSSCAGILEAFGMSLGCSSNDTTNSYPKYSSDTATCNGLASTAGKQLVAGKTEPYVGAMCKGVTVDLLVPSTTNIDPTGAYNLAPMLPPFVAQAFNEAYLAGVFSSVPLVFTRQCLTDLRKLFCPLKFLKARPLSDVAAYFGTVYMPSFPNQQLCLDFQSSCAYLITKVPSFNLACTSMTTAVSGAKPHVFPNATQVVAIVLGIPLSTSPNMLDDGGLVSGYHIEPECPYAMAVPANPKMPQTVYLSPNFACALQCPLRLFSNEAFNSLNILTVVMSLANWILLVVALVNIWATDKKRRNVYITLCTIFQIGSFSASLLNLFGIQNYHEGDPMTAICSSRTSWYHMSDALVTAPGPTGANSAKAAVCMMQGFSTRTFYYVSTGLILNMYVEVWVRVVLNIKGDAINRPRAIYTGTTTFVLGFLYLFHTFQPTATFNAPLGFAVQCGGTSGIAILDDILTRYLLMVVFTIEIVLAFWGISKCVLITMKAFEANEKNPFRKLWKSYRTLFTYILTSLAFYPIFLAWIAIYIGLIRKPQMSDGVLKWLTCLIGNFKNSAADPSLGVGVCGSLPSKTYTLGEQSFSIMIGTLQAIINSLSTNTTDSDKFWWSIMPTWLQNSVLCFICHEHKVGSILPSDKTSIGDTSVANKDLSSVKDEEDSDDESTGKHGSDLDDAEASLKVTVKRDPRVTPIDPSKAKSMGDDAAKLAAQLYSELDQKDGASAVAQERRGTPPSTDRSTPVVSDAGMGVDGESKDNNMP